MGILKELNQLLGNHLSARFQIVIFNKQMWLWKPVLTGSVLDPFFFFFVYINDLPNELKSSVKLFADVISLFTIVKDANEIANILINDLLSS